MEKNLLILGSVTYAMKAKDLLFSKGIKAYIERHKNAKEYGCGYAVYVPNNAKEAEKILIENNIKIRAFVNRGEI